MLSSVVATMAITRKFFHEFVFNIALFLYYFLYVESNFSILRLLFLVFAIEIAAGKVRKCNLKLSGKSLKGYHIAF